MNLWRKKLSKKEHNVTITNVLIGSYIRSMLFSLIIGIVLFVGITGMEMSYRRSLSNERILNIVTYIINDKLEDIRQFSDELVIDDELQSIFRKKSDLRSNLLSSFLMKRLAQLGEVSSIHVIWEDAVVSEFKSPVYGYDKYEVVRNLKLNFKGDYCWEIGTDHVNTDENTFYIIRNVKSKLDMKHLGYLVVYLDINQLQQDIKHYLGNEAEIIVQSAQGEIITFPGDLPVENVKKRVNILNRGENSWKYLSGKYSIKELTNINGIMLITSKQSIFSPNLEFAIIFMLIIIIDFTIIASKVLKKRVIGPLEEIAARAKEIAEKENLDMQFPQEEYYSEADDISNALNEMMTQIRGLLEDVKKKEKLQRQLELSVINHQIKPHFLYNTLNAASILVSVEEKEAARQLIMTLASYYRACLNHGNDIISLEGELNIIKDYVKIALIRNPNIAKLSYDIDESLLSLQIPKMTIQTLVENSIKYGIKSIGQPISISVSAKKVEDHAEIIVEDDGVGMSKDTIEKVMKGEELEVKSGFGLRSVLNRLALLYEIKDYSNIMNIQSEPNNYTKITLKLKL
ncbi:sensor histidine kinase [Defluviitalea raffinosedens]|uniref:sensor histidine kinase n=1 Tax=Defluviitalea raffinosedens TaxID=1450156 RepID=UPI00195CBDE0|nr:histidine kinase [Defluviitalea raffinosedens]MBM7684824.1 sensor histidine kinase YesM [Defluviitalea raffinosedens]